MYTVSVEKHFDSAHYLRGYKGKCEELHGHRFRVVVSVTGQTLDDIGLVYDFTDLKKHLGEIVERLDHVCLNDIEPFTVINPSSEHLAKTIYEELEHRLADEPVKMESVQVWESPVQGITFKPD